MKRRKEAHDEKNPSTVSGSDLPVENVTWLDAIRYCNARSEKEGFEPAYTIEGQTGIWNRGADGYRLPMEAVTDPIGAETGTLRVYRGGGWNDFAKNMRSAYRATFAEDKGSFNIGIRLVRGIAGGSESVTSAFFSWGGNTKGIAEEIQSQTGADLFEIELVNPYSNDYNTVLDEAQRDQNEQARPELANHVEEWLRTNGMIE